MQVRFLRVLPSVRLRTTQIGPLVLSIAEVGDSISLPLSDEPRNWT